MVHHPVIHTKSAEETAQVGERFAHRIAAAWGKNTVPGDRIFCLYGELGSGKTTFSQGFAKGLGITGRLLSPTFIIVRRYTPDKSIHFLYHLDLYRLQSWSEIENLAFSEMTADANSAMLIEWADRLQDHVPSGAVHIRFTVAPDGGHTISVHKTI